MVVHLTIWGVTFEDLCTVRFPRPGLVHGVHNVVAAGFPSATWVRRNATRYMVGQWARNPNFSMWEYDLSIAISDEMFLVTGYDGAPELWFLSKDRNQPANYEETCANQIRPDEVRNKQEDGERAL